MTVSGFHSKRCFEADFGIWRLILLFVRFFLVQTFMGSAIAACTLFGPIMFRVQPDLIEAPIRIPFLSSPELGQEAGSRLIYLLRDKKLQKKPECRAIVEKWSSQLLFSPDPEIRKIMIHFLSHNQREAITLPVERHSEHLSSIYGTQTLEINGAIISQNQNCVIVRGMFQQQKVNLTADVSLWEKIVCRHVSED